MPEATADAMKQVVSAFVAADALQRAYDEHEAGRLDFEPFNAYLANAGYNPTARSETPLEFVRRTQREAVGRANTLLAEDIEQMQPGVGLNVRLVPTDKPHVTDLVIEHNGREMERHSDDPLEPEKNRFDRELRWIPDLVRWVYELGKIDASQRRAGV